MSASDAKGNAKIDTNTESRSVKIGEAGNGGNAWKEPIRSAMNASGIASTRASLSNDEQAPLTRAGPFYLRFRLSFRDQLITLKLEQLVRGSEVVFD